MSQKFVSIGAAAVVAAASALAVAGPALAGSPAGVSVRVEGGNGTLMPAKTVRTPSGYIRKFGAPAATCPFSSAQGALAVATHGNWQGSWSTKYSEYFITGILGVTASGASHYWEVFVNNVAATAGACEIKTGPGTQLLFADVPTKGPAQLPLGVSVPASATVGKQFFAKVVAYNANGRATPLAGATVTVGGKSGLTTANGQIPLTASRAGAYTIAVSKTGHIRTEATVEVSAA